MTGLYFAVSALFIEQAERKVGWGRASALIGAVIFGTVGALRALLWLVEAVV